MYKGDLQPDPQHSINGEEPVLQDLHEDLLHFVCAPGSGCSLIEGDSQRLRLWDGRQRAWPQLATSLMGGGKEVGKCAGLPGNAAGAPLESDSAPLQACAQQTWNLC